MQFKLWLENQQQYFYHGSPHKFDVFSYEHTGKGHEQEGPGFYFTTDETDAQRYATSQGHVYKAILNLKKTVPLKGKQKTTEIVKLIKQAPNLKAALEDWDENPNKAFQNALNAMLKYSKNPHDAFQQVWYDFYYRSGNTKQYLENMTKLGYDGVFIPKRHGVIHAIVFNPNAIQIIKV